MTAKAFKEKREQLAKKFLSDEDADAYLLGHTEAADEAVKEIVRNHGLSPRIAVTAIGGFGRRQLFPFSDLDLLFLLPDDLPSEEIPKIEECLGDLWSLGLVVGHSVRNIRECLNQAAEDITAQTAMLESRLLCGDEELFAEYERQIKKQLVPKDFFRAKFIEQEQRHIKFAGTPYSLEPQIKESPGGLRDLNILMWLLKASGTGSSWNEAAKNGLITKHEADLLNLTTDALYRLRIHMHLLKNRHEDRLLFDVQLDLSKKLQIIGTSGRQPSEILMQRYYVNAKSIIQLNSIILQALKERFQPETNASFEKVNDYFQVSGEVLDIVSDDVFVKHPDAILKAFLFAQDHPNVSRKSTRLYRALLAAHSQMNQAFREDPRNKETFKKIVQHKRGVYHTLLALNKWGVLGRFIPSFKRIVGQMQHDLFHVYTVDHHTLLAVRNMRHFTKSENAHEMPLCTELMVSLKDNWRLVLALLFHDIGKGRGGDHSILGAEEFRKFAQDIGLKEEDAKYIEFLVAEHLTMSLVAQKQDTTDPETIENFAKRVKNIDRLTGLYLMTVCDIRATSPTLWNSWKGQLLEDLFHSTSKVLRGRGLSRSTLVDRRRKDALARGKFSEEEAEKISEFWEQLDVAYFMRHPVNEIIWQARHIIPHLGKETTLAQRRPIKGMPHNHEVMVLTKDKPVLFAGIVSAFQKFGLSILEARIHTAKNGWVLDTFIVTEDGSEPDIEAYFDTVLRNIEQSIDSNAPLPAPTKGRLSRRSKSFPVTPAVSLHPDANGKQHMLSIIATDRLGLLSAISRVFVRFAINLQGAKIATLGERVEDVFLIEGQILSNPIETASFEKALLQSLEP